MSKTYSFRGLSIGTVGFKSPYHVTVCFVRLQLKCDGKRRLTGGEAKGKLANGVGSQCPSHYLGTTADAQTSAASRRLN